MSIKRKSSITIRKVESSSRGYNRITAIVRIACVWCNEYSATIRVLMIQERGSRYFRMRILCTLCNGANIIFGDRYFKTPKESPEAKVGKISWLNTTENFLITTRPKQ